MEKRGRSFSIDPIRRAARRMRGLLIDNPERILRFVGDAPHGDGSNYVIGLLHNVERLGAHHYRAVGHDPQLALTPAVGELPHGWICLAMQVSTPPAYPYAPQFFFDTGEGGWSEAHSIHLPTPVNGQIVAFFQLPPQVVALRLDVGDEAGLEVEPGVGRGVGLAEGGRGQAGELVHAGHIGHVARGRRGLDRCLAGMATFDAAGCDGAAQAYAHAGGPAGKAAETGRCAAEGGRLK